MARSAPPQSMKRQVFACITKLADRDTHALAAAELESIAATIDHSSLPVFLSCIHATGSTDKPLVRKQCVRLLAFLAENYGDALSSYLPKMISTITKRLRDHDSSIRSTCIATTGALARHVTKPPFSSFLKPFSDALFTEQDSNSQIGAALCLASAVEASADPEPGTLMKILPRLGKLLKCESFKAKAALITLIGSFVDVRAASAAAVLKILVPNVLQFLSSQDWAARKAAAGVLLKLAITERDMLVDFKAASMKVLEDRKFDKVRAVREVMNQMLEAWKQIPDVSDEYSPPPISQASSREDVSDGRYTPGSKNSYIASCGAPQMRMKNTPTSRSTPPEGSSASTARKRRPLMSSDTKMSPAMFQKLDRKKPLDLKVEVATTHSPLSTACEDGMKKRSGNIPENRFNGNSRHSKLETKRILLSKNSDENMQKVVGSKAGSSVAPYLEENSDNTVLVTNVIGEPHRHSHKDCEELSSIQKQLLQIEKQQSNLLDLLQRLIGSSQTGMQSLETRVHGLELVLDGISHDLVVSSARRNKEGWSCTTCCRLPGADLLSSKFWRRTEKCCSTSGFSPSGSTSSAAATRHRSGTNVNAYNSRFQIQGADGLIVNPLAEVPNPTRGNSGVAHYYQRQND